MSEVNVSFRVDDAETEALLSKRGSAVRDNVTFALAKVTAETLREARGAAPTKRVADGLMAYGTEQDNAWNERGSGSGMPREMLNAITRTLQLSSQGQLTTIIANTYYLGRFREEGFSGTVDVRAHTRRARGRKSWARPRHIQKLMKSYRATYGDDAKGRAKTRKAAGTMYTDRKLRLMFSKRGGQVSVDFYKRKHSVKRTPFMPDEARVSARLKSAVEAAIREGRTL